MNEDGWFSLKNRLPGGIMLMGLVLVFVFDLSYERLALWLMVCVLYLLDRVEKTDKKLWLLQQQVERMNFEAQIKLEPQHHTHFVQSNPPSQDEPRP